jgi:general secretion pathway protein A
VYCELFGLNELPFGLTPDPQFLFSSKQHARAKAYMESTIWLADGFVVVTGEIGSGKTTLIESFLAELPDDVVLAYISQTQLSPVEFLQALLVEFGFQPFKQRKIELLSMLKDFLVEKYAQGKKVLLVVDEAQNLSRKVLEEIRLLSGIESRKEKVLRIILAGQPELSSKLDSPRLAQLMQRVRLRFHLGALSKRETQQYVTHRLNVAGANGREIFDADALDTVYSYSGGIPRLVNVLCDTAMLCAFAEETATVDAAMVQTAAAELQWVDYAERIHGHEIDTGETGAHPAVRQAYGRLEVLHRRQFVTNYELAPGRAIIGRTSDNDLQIRSNFISRHHAQIISDPQQSLLEDLNSTNGVFVLGQRVKRHRLVEGDVIQLGEHQLVYREMRGQTRLPPSSDISHENMIMEADDTDTDTSLEESAIEAEIGTAERRDA